MTPLKAASRAYVNAGGNQSGRTAYDAFSDEDQLEADDAMRAALMALADEVENKEFRAMLHSMCHATGSASGETSSAQAPLQTKSEQVAEEPYLSQLVGDICHDEQVEIWADELSFHLMECIVDPEDYEHKIDIHNAMKMAVKDLAEKVIEDCLYCEGRILRPAAEHEAGLKSEATPSAPPAAADHDTNRSIATNNWEAE